MRKFINAIIENVDKLSVIAFITDIMALIAIHVFMFVHTTTIMAIIALSLFVICMLLTVLSVGIGIGNAIYERKQYKKSLEARIKR